MFHGVDNIGTRYITWCRADLGLNWTLEADKVECIDCLRSKIRALEDKLELEAICLDVAADRIDAALLGRKGGQAGKGASKRRGDSAYYKALRAKPRKPKP